MVAFLFFLYSYYICRNQINTIMTIYRSKIDHWIWIFILISILACLFTPIIKEPNLNTTALLMLILSIVIPALVIINIYTNTYYTIDDEKLTLRVRSGFLVDSKYDINKITKIRNTRTWLSSPALSMDRIEISVGRYNKVVISPQNKAQFISNNQRRRAW